MANLQPFIIRPARAADVPAMFALVKELALFEKAPEQVTNSEADMLRDGFGEQPVFRSLVAECEGQVVGLAIFFVKYSTWKGKGLYLDDLIVTETYRGRGIGLALLKAYLEEARRSGARQVHWQVLDWNQPAIDLYKKMGASLEAEWLDCKMNVGE
ncbi:MAG: GNAT family N-acetyltransferase [Bacteroidota bacterium]|jgi:GNAT superfamily N-acetyltransferase|uniref:GNAT family N-acetyltransferase n=1 Tax=Candidatus Pollutiaquabacter sp. TaxID=3416354 RepID=UPI001A5795A4|nr:GNAT family N-acetyltransferase [Bacteroidota bacterium]MBL7948992.1 GNAT family N-acetyltransferase [Bacteroidia bacterium]HRI41627.1 GNAT family N-acetyltransferase [Bacteroidia bacterium]HRS40202.1 GNAT family N-acetyltransferase [Bacteroidia bacterium]